MPVWAVVRRKGHTERVPQEHRQGTDHASYGSVALGGTYREHLGCKDPTAESAAAENGQWENAQKSENSLCTAGNQVKRVEVSKATQR